MPEKWTDLSGFPDYQVSREGQIFSQKTERVLTPTVNLQGHLKVNLWVDRKQVTRAVSHLIAKTYLPLPSRPDFRSLIHFNGDKTNCRVENLDWRPYHFTLKYHDQFQWDYFKRSRTPIRDLKSGETYSSIQEAVIKHGLLFKDILISMHERTYVWPTYQEFGRIE